MFQTLQPQSSFRINKTAIPRKHRNPNPNIHISQRPHTMDLTRQAISQKINQLHNSFQIDKKHLTLRTSNQTPFKTINDAQIQVTNSFKKQLSPYLHEKIRYSLSRNQPNRFFFSRTSNYQDNPQNQYQQSFHTSKLQSLDFENTPLSINLKQMKLSKIFNRQLKSPLQSKELVLESIITNTKEKIDRMIGLKRQRQQQYQQLKKSIEKKRLIQNRISFNKISVLNPTGAVKPPMISTLEWDKQWQEDLKKESNRYRNRLYAKHKRGMSMKIPIPQICD